MTTIETVSAVIVTIAIIVGIAINIWVARF
jgi:hypothetical protein